MVFHVKSLDPSGSSLFLKLEASGAISKASRWDSQVYLHLQGFFFSQSKCPGRNEVLSRDRHTLTHTGVAQGQENVFSFILCISYFFLSKRLQGTLLSKRCSPQWVCSLDCHRALAIASLHYVPSLSPHHAHLMRGYSSCACAVQQSSFSSLFPPAQTRAETLPSRKAWPRTTWVQAVQSSDEISSRSLWSVRGKACIPCRNGDTGPYWLSKFFCWDLAEISVALSHHTAAVTSVWWIFSLMPPCWDVFLWYLWTAGESWSRGWDDHRELQYLAHVFRKQSVLISMEFTIIPPLCLQVSCVSVGFGRSPYVEEFGPISPLCC